MISVDVTDALMVSVSRTQVVRVTVDIRYSIDEYAVSVEVTCVITISIKITDMSM